MGYHIRNVQRCVSLTLLFLLCPLMITVSAQNEIDTRTVESATWRVEYDNDVFFGKDNKISHGWSLQKHSAIAGSWRDLQDVPEFVRYWGSVFPTLSKEGLYRKSGVAIGQVIQTPDDLSRTDRIEEDVPYAGVLTLQATWYIFNDREFRGFEITAGVAGPPAMGEQVQKTVHELIGSPTPRGWDHQLSTEPVLNLNYMGKEKIYSIGNPARFSFDTAINGNIGLGNLFTQASLALELRFGHNIPGGFVYVPDPIGLSMHYLASLQPAAPQAASIYATLVLRGSVFAHNIFIDGNSFTTSHSLKKEPLVGLLVAGLHYQQKNWGVHFNVMLSSDNVDTSQAAAVEGSERLGSINIEWRL